MKVASNKSRGRAGEMLKDIELNTGAMGVGVRLHDVTTLPPKLEELGISKIQSHRWQLEAEIQQLTIKVQNRGITENIEGLAQIVSWPVIRDKMQQASSSVVVGITGIIGIPFGMFVDRQR